MVQHLQRLAAHGEWADARLLAAVQRAAGDITAVLRELAHVRGAQETWMARIEGRAATLPVWPTLTAGELAETGAALDAQWRRLMSSLTPSMLERDIAYANSAGRAFSTPLGDILLQVLTHGPYHRGKANAALRAIGAEPVSVDYIAWQREAGPGRADGATPRYLRVSIARWNIDTQSPEAEHLFRLIETDGVAVFRSQPGFVRYRLMRENSTTTIAVAEWESEALGLAGAEQYRAWMRRAGIMNHLTLETHTGRIVAAS